MIYICAHTDPAYSIDAPHQIIDTKSCCPEGTVGYAMGECWRTVRAMQALYMNAGSLPDEVGLFQQRRRLSVTSIPAGFRCAAPRIQFGDESVKGQYSRCHCSEDIELMERIIEEPSFSQFLNAVPSSARFHNMLILKKLDFISYAKFIIDSLIKFNEVKDLHDRDSYLNAYRDSRQATAPQFLAERLGAYWLWRNVPQEQTYDADVIVYKRDDRPGKPKTGAEVQKSTKKPMRPVLTQKHMRPISIVLRSPAPIKLQHNTMHTPKLSGFYRLMKSKTH